jgi:hypothetical protein
MLISKLLRLKNTFTKENGDVIVDLASATFSFETDAGISEAYIRVSEEEQMRPDLLSVRMYGEQRFYEALLKYNGISNPFSIQRYDLLLVPPYKSLERMMVAPKDIVDIGAQQKESNEDKLLNPKTVKDKKRLEALKDKVKEIVPPNVNTKGNQNVKVKDGKVIFGEDVTQVNKENCPVPISRARLIQQLTKANLF